MMQIKIEIDEKYIQELVTQAIADRIVSERGYESREAKYGIREGVGKAVTKYIYVNHAQKIFTSLCMARSVKTMDSITDICYDWMPNKEGRIRDEYIKPLEREIERLQSENTRLKAERDKAVEDIEKIYSSCVSCDICGEYEVCDLRDCSIGFCESFKYRGLEESE